MAETTTAGWSFLTNHAQVLVSVAREPGIRLRDIGERIGITERAAHRIVVELAGAGYITRERSSMSMTQQTPAPCTQYGTLCAWRRSFRFESSEPS
jgi:hypothetical protein